MHGNATPEQIRYTLVILMQHGCIYAEQSPVPIDAEVNAGKGFNYRVNKQSIINRLRFASFILNIRDAFGDIGVFIIERIIDHGRISFGYLLAEYEKYLQSNASLEALSSSTPNSNTDKLAIKHQLKDAFDQLISARHIKVSPFFLPSKSTLLEQQYAQDVTRKSHATSAIPASALNNQASGNNNNLKKNADTITRKRRVTTPYPSKNSANEFDSMKTPEDDGLPLELRLLYKLDEEAEAEMEFEPVKKETVVSVDAMSAGSKKRKGGGDDEDVSAKDTKKKKGGRVVVDEDDEINASSNTLAADNSSTHTLTPTPELDGLVSTGLWELNWDQYYRMKRHSVCITYCKERMGNLAGSLCKHLLDYSVKYESG